MTTISANTARAPTPAGVLLDRQRQFRLAIAAAVVLGCAVRAWHVLAQDFPLNDGGLFYAMVRDLQAAHYHLPATTSYNGAHIPYAYSPLAFYLAAALNDATPLTLLDIFRWFPLVASCLVVVAFAVLASRLLASRAAAIAAVMAFAVVPRSFAWMIMGGGVTRSLGFLFALVTLIVLHRFYVTREWRFVPVAAIAAGLTLLSHLGTAPFVAFSAALLWLAYGRHRDGTTGSLVAAAGAALVSSPWWLSVLATHGAGPFLAAAATGGSIFRTLDLRQALGTLAYFGLGTGEPVLGLIGLLATVGFFYSLAARDWLLPAWWIAIVVLDARQGSTFATVPVSLLSGVAIVHVLLPALQHAWRAGDAPLTLRRRGGLYGWSPKAVLVAFTLFAVGSALLRLPNVAGGLPDLVALSPDERTAMGWVADETPSDAKILVVAGTPWEIDRNSEWLPVLGRRTSIATVQGYEWRPIGEFAAKKREYNDVQACAAWSTECLENWRLATGHDFTYVYIPERPTHPCCAQLLLSLNRDAGYQRVYDGPGAVLFLRLASDQASATTLYRASR